MSLPVVVWTLAVSLSLAGCSRSRDEGTLFQEIAAAAGVEFVYDSGAKGRYFFPEIAGGGAALFDYDKDGDLDLYLVQGGDLTAASGQQPRDRLYRNDLRGGVVRFTDVSEEAGIDDQRYGMGVAVGDIDNDGWPDLYLTNVGSNRLYRNNGDGTFSDITGRAGVDDPRWSASASFFDYDRDGFLDLFVTAYVSWEPDIQPVCRKHSGARDYCGPDSHPPTPDRLFRNLGDGRFQDVSLSSGIALEYGAGLGVVTADLDGDGWQDIYVANDQMVNFLWRHAGNGLLENNALMAGAAVNADGRPEASMGIDLGDIDNDGDLDLLMTHLRGQTNTVYFNEGNGVFRDLTGTVGLAAPSVPFTGFGTALVDLDNDGWLDAVIANGAVTRTDDPGYAGDMTPYEEPNQVFLRRGGAFEDASLRAGSAFRRPRVSRGLAVGDIDNDGDTDLVVCNILAPAQVFLNMIGDRNHWVGLRVLSVQGRDAYGARVVLQDSSGRGRVSQVRADGSYLSANDPRVRFGLADRDMPVNIEIIWLDGSRERWAGIPVDRYTTLRAGTGETAP